MSQAEQRNRVAVAEVTTRAAEPEAQAPVEESPLYGVAMLKIAMELKKPGTRDLDEILSGVLERMRIPEAEFRAFLSQNGGMLRAIAQKRKY